MTNTFVFDLDQTVVDSSHRTPLKDGKVDLVKYISLQTRENIFKDKILPLGILMKKLYKDIDMHIIVCTARKMTQDDYDFLVENDLQYHELFERGNVPQDIANLPDEEYKMKCLKKYRNVNYIFYDDSEDVIKKFRNYENVTMVDSKWQNKKLAL